MYCKNCGKEAKEGEIFCTNCGARLPAMPPENSSANATKSGIGEHGEQKLHGRKAVKRKGRKCLIAVGATVIVLALVLSFRKYDSSRKIINLNDCVAVSFEGVDSVGSAQASLDASALGEQTKNLRLDRVDFLYQRFAKKTGISSCNDKEEMNFWNQVRLYKDSMDADRIAKILLNVLAEDGALDRKEGLSNGEEVVWHWEISAKTKEAIEGAFHCRLTFEDKQISVRGLTALKEYDPWTNATVVFDGTAPYGTAKIQVGETSQDEPSVTYHLSRDSGLSNGDQITVTAESDHDNTYDAEHYGMVAAPLEKTFEVEGLPYWIQSEGDISKDGMKEMIQVGTDEIPEFAKNHWLYGGTVDSITYIGNYYLTCKDPEDDVKNYIVLCYKMMYGSGGQTETCYSYCAMANILLEPDGDEHVDGIVADTSGYFFYDSLEELKSDIYFNVHDRYNWKDNIESSEKTEQK